MNFFWNIIFPCVLFLSALGAHASESELPADIVQQASFAEDTRILSPAFAGRQTAGVTVYEMNGWGLNYNRAITEKDSLWIQFNGKTNTKMFTEIPGDGTPFPNADVLEKNKYVFAGGVDRLFHLTENKYWGFVVGLGAGIAATEYETKHYRSMCTLICGYDPRMPTVVEQRDDYGFIVGRLGVSFRQTTVWGVKGDITFGVYPELLRTGEKTRFISPEGKEVHLHNFVSWALEGSVEF